METTLLIPVLSIVIGASFLLTWLLRRYALARSLMDIPNARSSHSMPTPRGGGLAFVVCFIGAVLILQLFSLLDAGSAAAICGAGGLVALIGFLDDHGHIAARWRLLGHFTAAIWALFWLGGLPPVILFGAAVDLGWFGHVMAAIYLVWLLNLYNFMDGIDGIASVEALCACVGGALLYLWLGSTDGALFTVLVLAASVLGFLIWNFPPARIFMGDAGSGFLGIILGVLSLQAAALAPQLLWAWLILLGVFVVDATFTLLHRLLRGERVYEAHRSHAYQYASRHYGRHLPVTVAVTVINLLWLLPLALWVGMGGIDGMLCLLIAYLPLVVLAAKFKAGSAEPTA